jgi:hypothetical protein
LKGALDLGRIFLVEAPQHALMQMDNRPANLRVGFGGTAGHHIRLDVRKEPAFGGRAAEI